MLLYPKALLLSSFSLFFHLLASSFVLASNDLEENENYPPTAHHNIPSSFNIVKYPLKALSLSSPLPSKNKALITIKNLQNQVQNAYNQASLDLLFQSYTTFNILNYEETRWEEVAGELQIRKWPLQKKWRDVVGGYLFFPRDQIYSYLETNYTYHLLERSDILGGCGFAASFNHALGLFYLGHTLISMNPYDQNPLDKADPGEATKFSYNILDKAYEGLSQTLDDADVFYSIAQASFSRIVDHDRYNPLQMLKKQNILHDLKSHFMNLELSRRIKDFSPSIPTFEDYLILARKGYNPAYLITAHLLNENKNRRGATEILEEAVQKGYGYAYLKLSEIHESTNVSLSARWLQASMKSNIPQAFIEQGIRLVGDINWTFNHSDFFSISPEIYNQAKTLFSKAAVLQDPRGFMYLGRLNELLALKENSSEMRLIFQRKARDAYIEGCKLGESNTYSFLYKFSPLNYNYVCEKIYPDPTDDLWKVFKNMFEIKLN